MRDDDPQPRESWRVLPRIGRQRHDAFMRLPWNKSKEIQLDLLEAEPSATTPSQPLAAAPRVVASKPDAVAKAPPTATPSGNDGRPLSVPVSMLYEDAHNPRTEFPEESINELAEDIRQRGVLQPLVVHPADIDGRHQVHFGAKRLRAAIRAGLREVPVVVRDLPADRYAQVAENQKRHGLTPL
jgi:ParB family transcriptional regulator, chromosome partitioning protein